MLCFDEKPGVIQEPPERVQKAGTGVDCRDGRVRILIVSSHSGHFPTSETPQDVVDVLLHGMELDRVSHLLIYGGHKHGHVHRGHKRAHTWES